MAYMTEVLAKQSSSWTIMGVLLPQNGHGFKVLFAFLIAASNFFVDLFQPLFEDARPVIVLQAYWYCAAYLESCTST